MCQVAGFYQPTGTFLNNEEFYHKILSGMKKALTKNSSNDKDAYLSDCCGLAHTQFSTADCSVTFNGSLYNTKELKCDLQNRGCLFKTTTDAEIVLLGFLEYGADFVKRLNGVFSFAIMDEPQNTLYLFRDRLGVKPLFYSVKYEATIFASEIKGLLSYPAIKPQISKQGLNEIFSLGPAKTPGVGVFQEISEVLPAHYLKISKEGIQNICYWQLESKPHEDDYSTTLEKVRFLVTDAIKRQMISNTPVCTFLSGGVDSSLVSAICAKELKDRGETLSTFSFDFVDNDKYFQSNSFQPSLDRPFVDIMVDSIQSNHYYLECSKESQADLLYDSVLAHDLPAMADIDSSMLYFCSIVKDYNKVVLTGECADEIFGGYPWFHREELFNKDTFPWTTDLTPRKALLQDDFLEYLQMEDYVNNAYYTSLLEVPALSSDSALEKRRREISYLNLKWFMQTLLDRMDRTSVYAGLEARVPFADYRIVEYLFNIPWEMKAKDGVVKNLLRNSCKGIVPDEILFRKKSPYPKTYDPHYESLLTDRLSQILEDSKAPILNFIDKKKTQSFLSSPSDYGKPWYGQLMAGPQMIAYLLQINFWMEHYKVEVVPA